MHEAHRDALARVHHESAEHIRRSNDSNEQSAEHVRQSKTAIARSLDLLRRPFFSK